MSLGLVGMQERALLLQRGSRLKEFQAPEQPSLADCAVTLDAAQIRIRDENSDC